MAPEQVLSKAVENIASRSLSTRKENASCYDDSTERSVPLNLDICGFVHALPLIAMAIYMTVLIELLFEKEFLLPNMNIACVHFFNYV